MVVSVPVIGPPTKVGDCAVAPLTPVGVGIQVNVFVPEVDAVSGRLSVLPLHKAVVGAVVVTTGAGFTAMLNVSLTPTQPRVDLGVIT